MKTCPRCSVQKPADAFTRNRSTRDGLSAYCRACANAYQRAARKADPARHAAYDERRKDKKAAWRATNPGSVAASFAKWRSRNVEYDRARNRRWFAENAGRSAAKSALRRAARLRATPPWLTREQRDEMAAAYHLARELGAHVDHIVPLKGANVCGLHVPWNLRVIPAAENLSKGNRLLETA